MNALGRAIHLAAREFEIKSGPVALPDEIWKSSND